MSALLAACVSSYVGPGWRWLEAPLRAQGVECRFFFYRDPAQPDRGPFGWGACRRAIALAREANGVLVTHGVPSAVRCAALQRLSPRRPVPHVAWSWHHAYTPRRRDRLLSRWIAPAVDAFVVHSQLEAEYQANLLGIAPDKFDVLPWPYEEGESLTLAAPPEAPVDYVCTIGASDRDYRTLFAAMERLPDVPLVAVLRADNLRGLRVPPNVQVHVDLPKAQAWSFLRGCRVFVLPLSSDVARTGHSVLVQAMAFGSPSVATGCRGLREYLRPGETALTVPPGDPDALARALRTLWDDRAAAAALGERGRQFAAQELSERRVTELTADLLRRAVGRAPDPAVLERADTALAPGT